MAGESCVAILRVESDKARALLEAVGPDNRAAPPWLSVSCSELPGALECVISMGCEEPSRLLSLRNTLEDLLLSLRAALEALEG
ncbi:MAG: KEOPS complex subunit Pcc1 [Acidilobaceae archaeon]|nr:KEOPS complex subunit Pcc1 [Acidilobaceae archaeon]